MADVSEKHRMAARQVLVGRRLAFAEESGPDALIDGISAALANAEREGMKRAEATCLERSKRHHKQAKKYESEGYEDSQAQCLADALEAMCCASDIRSEVAQV